MCRFRSYIVTPTEVLSCKLSDSHEDIIRTFGLDDSTDTPNFVRVEVDVPHILPPGPIEPEAGWVHIDQDYLPPWYYSACVAHRVCRYFKWELDTFDLYEHIVLGLPILDTSVSVDTRRYVAATLRVRDVKLPRITEQEEPDSRVRWLLAQCCERLDAPITVRDEPDANIRRTLIYHVANIYPLTVEEEPDEQVRDAYVCRWKGLFPRHRQRMLTSQEEPNARLLLEIWRRILAYGYEVTLPTYVGTEQVPTDALDRYVCIYNLTASDSNADRRIVALFCLLQAAARHPHIPDAPEEDYKEAVRILEELNPHLLKEPDVCPA